MKKAILLNAVCILCCTVLAACGGQSAEMDADWGTFQNDNRDVALTLGMQRQEVHQQLPAQGDDLKLEVLMEETDECLSVPYGETPEDAVTVYYDHGIVTGIWVDDSENPMETSHWSLAGGITKGSTLEEIQKVYGKNDNVTEGEAGEQLTYTYNADWERVETSEETMYLVTFVVGEAGLHSYAVEIMPAA